MKQLGRVEVNSVVAYIGVNNGYLGDFSYAKHAEFYPNYCGLDIDPNQYSGTTRERFIEILSNEAPSNQIKILKGVLIKYPLQSFEKKLEYGFITPEEVENKQRLYAKITQWISQLQGEIVEIRELRNDYEFVKEVLDQADTLISNHSCSSAIDRVHTALHGYIKEICHESNIQFKEQNVKIQDVWSKIKQEHPKFNINVKDHQKPINQIVNTISKTLENLNEIRNNQSFSHPNKEIIEETEARFMINLSRVLLQYIDSKITSS
ncbi:abortive infection family protein [Cytobacillus firmus]|uniref:abortive infection family protein n=1 Tax=Cytobacillus firmus TaxID=1399 RepID=UPI0021C94C99|nr:abortive infection family protein [Cytobacillus firmus]MCU1808159.1 abortive infection family protein [Cytobacillus firmus]